MTKCEASTRLNIGLDFCVFINLDEVVEVNENAKKERATLIHQTWSSRVAGRLGIQNSLTAMFYLSDDQCIVVQCTKQSLLNQVLYNWACALSTDHELKQRLLGARSHTTVVCWTYVLQTASIGIVESVLCEIDKRDDEVWGLLTKCNWAWD